ncbi:hypothetical protein SPWS13_1974 [Shewanella putrefaciens]|nr:hypothetical protein SPWS13_1974 [Shewanella putrefaciens]
MMRTTLTRGVDFMAEVYDPERHKSSKVWGVIPQLLNRQSSLTINAV